MVSAFEGLKVLDISQGVPGAFCAMQLGDLGVDVIKLEPLQGDWLRQIGPFVKGESALFLQLNRNKRGIAVDLKKPEGLQVAMKLAAVADVLIEAYRPGIMDRLGLGYDALEKVNPKLIYCSVSGLGPEGPLAQQPATEIITQGIMGYYRGLGILGEPPIRDGTDVASIGAGIDAVQGIAAALYGREKSGQGQKVEVSLLGYLSTMYNLSYIGQSVPQDASAFAFYTAPPEDGYYETKDIPMIFTFRRDAEAWRKFFKSIGLERLINDPRIDLTSVRGPDMHILKPSLEEVFKKYSYEELRKLIQDDLGGTIVPLHTYDSLFAHEQVKAMDVVEEMEHPTVGKFKTLNVPWDFQDTPATLRLPPPLLGQHTRKVLSEIGYEDSAIKELYAARVIA